AVAGAVQWMAPELLSIQGHKDYFAADVYAFGMILWELAAREPPYEGANEFAICTCVQRGERLDIPPDCPPDWARLVMRCWAQNPADRPRFVDLIKPLLAVPDLLEPILLRAARARGVDVRFETQLVAFTQDEVGVTATLRDGTTGIEHSVRSAYLIGADGSRSAVRKGLGIERSGSRTYGHQLNVLFHAADLAPLVRGREFSLCLVENAAVRGLIASIDNAATWVIHLAYEPERGERPDDFTPARCEALIREAVGIADLHVTILGVSPWQSAVRIAERYRQGRAFLAGDAAHSMSPWGGLGANTAIQDAHNLAWKLGLVLAGTAHESLLDTYEAERLPVGRAAGDIAGRLNGDRGPHCRAAALGHAANHVGDAPRFPLPDHGLWLRVDGRRARAGQATGTRDIVPRRPARHPPAACLDHARDPAPLYARLRWRALPAACGAPSERMVRCRA
ncbi:MAG: FAD-dependent monooxygenase, partial [Hydrogenophaga sp.]|uniref:FAD-dependent monooxygenase n=1 Tax=Hydrogenophaga sp. TaxID=1904254 RepID=UPI002635F69C